MTTKDSPLARLKEQADKMAVQLKAMERGDKSTVSDPAGKIAAARARGEITFGVVMDDKIIKITMPWETIHSTSEAGISEWIIAYMREVSETKQ